MMGGGMMGMGFGGILILNLFLMRLFPFCCIFDEEITL